MRLVLKTLSYGSAHVVVAVLVAYVITGDIIQALGIGLLEPVVQTGVFALHEMFWEGTLKARMAKIGGILKNMSIFFPRSKT